MTARQRSMPYHVSIGMVGIIEYRSGYFLDWSMFALTAGKSCTAND